MVDACVGPSQLHLKKELHALQKARLLQDPETYSSWRSNFHSRSSAKFSYSNHGNGARYSEAVQNHVYRLKFPVACRKRSNEVHLCNWFHGSSKSNDSGVNLDVDGRESSEKSSTNVLTRGRNPSGPAGRILERMNQDTVRNIKQLKVLNNVVEQSEDVEYCESEKVKHLKHDRRDSYNRYKYHVRSRGSSSFNGAEFYLLQQNAHRGCSIPRNWSSRIKEWDCGSGCSPSVCSTLGRRGTNRLCQQTRSSNSYKYIDSSRSPQSLPLLHNNYYGDGESAIARSDEFSTNIADLDLEGLSQLDGRRWSDGRDQAQVDVVRHEGVHSGMSKNQDLSEKYRPRSFRDIVGQCIVVQSLWNAISRGRIAPAYIFHGPEGTGKTSTARAFAAALNCLTTEENRPCGSCDNCTKIFSNQQGSSMIEIIANTTKGWDKLRHILNNMPVAGTVGHYKVLLIEECHMLSWKIWSDLSKILEDPPTHVVFIFITTDPARLPYAILSQCQRCLFLRIKEADILSRLRELCAQEDINIEEDALNLITSNSDGSLRKAEMMLNQLSLVGQKITSAIVDELVGVVSDEKLLALLETAMSSDTLQTVKKATELMNSGVDPISLTSRLAGVIMDIIAGNYYESNKQYSSTSFSTWSLNEAELERFQQALRILFEAENQLRLPCDKKAWFTAVLLQLGSCKSPLLCYSRSSSKQDFERSSGGGVNKAKETFLATKSSISFSTSASNTRMKSGWYCPQSSSSYSSSSRVKLTDFSPASISTERTLDDINLDELISKGFKRCVDPSKLDMIWRKCINRCNSKKLKQLLIVHGKLVLITQTGGVIIAYIAVTDDDIKHQAERFLSKITNLVEAVLKHNVKVIIRMVPEICLKALKSVPDPPSSLHRTLIDFVNDGERKHKVHGSDSSQHLELQNSSKTSVSNSNSMLQRCMDRPNSKQLAEQNFESTKLLIVSEDNNKNCFTGDKWKKTSMERQSTYVDEQKLDSLWIQTAEKSETGFVNHVKHKKGNLQEHPRLRCSNREDLWKQLFTEPKDQGEKRNDDVEELSANSSYVCYTRDDGWMADQYHRAISPSLLSTNTSKAKVYRQSLGYELETRHNRHPRITSNPKVKQDRQLHPKKAKKLACFGWCWKLKTRDSRFRR